MLSLHVSNFSVALNLLRTTIRVVLGILEGNSSNILWYIKDRRYPAIEKVTMWKPSNTTKTAKWGVCYLVLRDFLTKP